MPLSPPTRQDEPPLGFAEPRLHSLLACSLVRLRPLVEDVYGAHALMIGPDADSMPRVLAPMAAIRLRVATPARMEGELLAAPDRLPVPSGSMALVILQYALHRVDTAPLLAECARILAPEGILLIADINRFSLWNAWSRSRLGGGAPSASRCRRLLADEDIDTLQVRRFGPCLPRRIVAPERSADGRWLGALRASYLLIARKRRGQATPIRFARAGRSGVVSPGLAGSFRKAG